MDYQRPGTENSPPPSDGARIEEDRVRPLKWTAGSSRPRLPAALPFAIAGILVVSSVAFGATFLRSIVKASPSATPVVVGDENPTDSPSLAPSEAPRAAPSEAVGEAPSEAPSKAPTAAPSSGDLTLTADALPGKVQLTWTKYAGADFAYTYTDNGDGTYTFQWTQYTGGPFNYYKFVWGYWPGSPSYPSGSPYWAVPPVGAGSSDPIAVSPGEYAVRVQAIGYPNGPAYAYAQTTVLHLVVPAPSPSPTVCTSVVGTLAVVSSCSSPSPTA